jgi:hypothetical protein
MTPFRVIALLGSLWVSLVLLAAFGAWAEPDAVKSAAYNHAAWMFTLAGGVSAAFGLLLALIVALAIEVRTARTLGTASLRGADTGENPVGSGAVRSRR